MAQCPYCKKAIEKLTKELLDSNEGATVDCPHCGSLLIIKNSELLDFHKYLNKETKGEWPEDGHGTSYVET